jgi:hypothetical protein
MRRLLPLICITLLGFRWSDPAPSLLRSKDASRNLVCERLDPLTASQLRPGDIAPPPQRGDFMDRSMLLCTERLMRRGLRNARDEAILTNLDARTSELAASAHALRPDLQGRTWWVESHYPSAPVSSKITFAAKNALMRQGQAVTDRIPSLGAADIQVLIRMPADQAFPAACRRYHDAGILGPDDALLAVVSVDRRETMVHAGLCADGHWWWLR